MTVADKDSGAIMGFSCSAKILFTEMDTAAFSCDPAVTAACLYRFRPMNIPGCGEGAGSLYRFPVNPKENSECFIDVS